MQQPNPRSYPICKLDEQHVRAWDYGRRFTVECARCGKFTITDTAAAIAERKELGPKLSAWIRDRTDQGVEIAEINSRTLDEIHPALPNYRVAKKQLLLLRALERRTRFPGHSIQTVPEFDYALGLGLPVFWCVRKDDLPNVHFDTRQYNHIVWETEADLAAQLLLFVTAIVGKGSPT